MVSTRFSWERAGWLAALAVLAGLAFARDRRPAELPSRTIGTTAEITEAATGLSFAARVDTGAKTSSIHCEEMVIENAAADMDANVGKPIRFLIRNKRGEAGWIESRIADAVMVRTSEGEENRYKVPLTVSLDGQQREVLFTLNDRTKMTYAVLLGRNFLRDEFLVHTGWE